MSSTAPGFADFKAPGGKPIITSIFDFSAESLSELRLYLEQNPPAIGISNILGFSQFTASAAVITTSESRTSSTYGDLATVGPQITGLSDGKYLVIWGAAASGNPGVSNANMKIQSGAGGNTDHTLTASTSSAAATSVMAADTITLSAGGNNSLVAKYQSSDNVSSCGWNNRFVIALRYANK